MAFSNKFRNQRTGLYGQDQMKIAERWVLLLGGRKDWARDRSSPFFGEDWTRESSHAFTGRAGLVYLAPSGLAPFLSYSESFEPQGGTDSDGNRLDPTRGKQVELGLRYQPPGSDTLLTAALYELKQRDVVSYDADYTYANQTGEVRSRGLELELRTQLTSSLSVVAAYAYTDARVTRSNNPDELGARQQAVPRNQASIWGEYRFILPALPGHFKVGLGARYLDDIPSVWWAGDLTVPGYTVWDALASYETGRWRFSVNASNLADKKYLASCTYGSCYFGNGRQVIGEVSYRW